MGTINFATVFSGGKGSLKITSHETGTTMSFTQATKQPQSINLPMGNHIFSVTGQAPNGEGGNILLKITGDIPAEVDQNFPAGLIPPHALILFVTN